MTDHRLWMFGFLLVITSALSIDAQQAQLAPDHEAYPGKATHEKELERAADHNLRNALPIPAVAEAPKHLERAELTIVKYYDKVGKRLTATLADDEIPILERVRAAKQLGIMKYPPAIEVLIRNNELAYGAVVSDDWNLAFPCVRVLIEYGEAAVPQVVETYLEEQARSDRSRLFTVISTQSTRRTALIYAKGLATDTKDKDRSKRLQELIKRLSQ